MRIGRMAAVAVAALLSACAASPTPYWQIQPVHQVRNSPVPVPRPSLKPAAPQPEPAPVVVRVAAPAAAPAGTVVVRRGDTVYGIARARGVPVDALVAANRLEPPYLLQVGQRLRLPAPRVHVVRRGETAFSIARAHDVEVTDLARLNGLDARYLLLVGQRLHVPSGRAAEMAVASRASATLPLPPPRTGSGFDWPVTGVIMSRFGPKQGGLRNDGINIAAPAGAPVRAAEDGVVAYAGEGLKGFGKLVLVRHSGDWVTAYAHKDELLVARGDRVRRGQMIGRVGKTGAVTEPQLHFEIRKGAKALDPLGLLPTVQASAE